MIWTLTEMRDALGGDIAGRQVLAPGPYHRTSDRSLSVRPCDTAPDGFTVHSFAGDDFRACRDHVKGRLGIALGPTHREFTPAEKATWAERRRQAEREEEAERRRRIDAALRIWNEAVEPAGTMVSRYLATRGLDLPADLAGHVLRFHPACPWRTPEGASVRLPAMVALMRDIRTDEPCGVHRTAFDAQGRKVGRKMLGAASGAAIKLDPDTAVCWGLTIGEGVETCMTARVMGLRPTWALGSAGAIAAFPTLAAVETLTILEEIDGGASRRAVEECGERWADIGREVHVVLPKAGSDLNDHIRRDAA